MPNPSFPVACMQFFGKKDGQTTLDFRNEYKALTFADKMELYAEFQAMGIPCEAPLADTKPA